MTREQQIEEAIRVRPSKRAMALLREDLEIQEELADSHNDALRTGALRILVNMHDKLP